MKSIFSYKTAGLVFLAFLWSCDQKNDGVISPIDPEKIPQVILFDDEEAGEEEDSDETSFKLTLLDKIDPEGKELGGKIIPLTANVTVNFKVTDIEGFSKISDYILSAEGSYEKDECNDEDVAATFNTSTGEGTVVFPAGAEEVEINFELNDKLFDDMIVNKDDRSFKVQITGITGGNGVVVANKDLEFEHKVLDDDVIFAEWELDTKKDLKSFQNLFGSLHEDIAGLKENEIKGIKFQFGLNQLEIEVELEEEEENDCGEMENKTIEIEAEYDDLTDDKKEGDIKFIVEVEDEAGYVEEVEYEGSFKISGEILTITLSVDGVEKTLTLKLD
ncbi:hypothetical protein GVN16_06255 [Emticicia sp. CRIBPO]|uniref:hypothetical protein n=1 Tax=Emticicia sp. CRIBPO TaxID=2683258 RepID=UPI001411C426|nr:hypothetical protein [Emticicia sp. CRIBPO]NBA85355.1 hypothetical protein [Emticicia sp. CRIBPO]